MSVEDHVIQFLSTKGDPRFVTGAPYRLFEYNKLHKFWKEFGLNKFDLQKCSMEWINEMLDVITAIEKYKSSNQQSGQQTTTQKVKGSNNIIKSQKLL